MNFKFKSYPRLSAPRSGSLCASVAALIWICPMIRAENLDASLSATPLPTVMSDPLEPLNRSIWEVNRGILLGVMQPVGRMYRTVVPKPVRGSIANFSRNITYPGRVLNHALQGRWTGAGDETRRFICNTTAGVGGFFDVASTLKMPKSNADFSQTFGKWGWKPNSYLILPLLGPSDDRHAVGSFADRAAAPWNYSESLMAASYGSTFNRLSDQIEDRVRMIQPEYDSYALTKDAWTHATKDQKPDWQVRGPVDSATLQTFGVIQAKCQNPDFPASGRLMSVRIPSTGRKLKFNYWLQPSTAPVVYVSPGLSSHRLSDTTLWLAEYLYQNGFSVVTTTSVFHPEFMEQASSSDLPVYPPNDSHDLHVALTEMDRALAAKYHGKLGKRALVGCSMGGFLTLRLAAGESSHNSDLLRFDRYLAIDSPVDLRHGVQCVDAFQNAPLAWPKEERQRRVDNAFQKAAMIGAMVGPAPSGPVFDEVESKYLIGMTFRLTLRDIIYSCHKRHDRHELQKPINPFRRDASYQEIMGYSFEDYLRQFAVSYCLEKGIRVSDLTREGNLRSHEEQLRLQPKIRVLANRNDFLLTPNDVDWLERTFKKSQLTILPDGGHLGNLSSQPVRKAILRSLSGLQ
ncbi:MAG: VacJ family lipoprotein [Akkermansiaceae bacterium]|nr:VacJ family lipoprotein [Akkermansiaceae bacterium]